MISKSLDNSLNQWFLLKDLALQVGLTVFLMVLEFAQKTIEKEGLSELMKIPLLFENITTIFTMFF